MKKQEIITETEIADTREKIMQKLGEELMDIDFLTKSVYKNIPMSNIYQSYFDQLNLNFRIHLFFTILGFLLLVSVFIFL